MIKLKGKQNTWVFYAHLIIFTCFLRNINIKLLLLLLGEHLPTYREEDKTGTNVANVARLTSFLISSRTLTALLK